MKKIVYLHDIVGNDHAYLNKNMFTLESKFQRFLSAYSDRIVDVEEFLFGSNDNDILLTFDDGFKSFREVVIPYLEDTNTPATIFVTTDFIGNRFYPYELLLNNFIQNVSSFYFRNNKYVCNDYESKIKWYDKLKNEFKSKPTEVRKRFITELFNRNSFSHSLGCFYLSWDDLRELNKHPLVTIGAHTKTHPSLGRISYFQAFQEIFGSKMIIERELQEDIKYFSYPYGGSSFVVKALARLAGFSYAFATSERPINDIATVHKFAVPRIDFNKY